VLTLLHCIDVNIPIFVVLYLGFKIVKRTSFWKPHEMDFVTVSI
jgi:amino acid transporter